MQPPYFLRCGFPRFPREGTRGEGNKAAALEAKKQVVSRHSIGGLKRTHALVGNGRLMPKEKNQIWEIQYWFCIG